MKRRYYSERTEESQPYDKSMSIHFTLPAFMKEGLEVTGIERGTAIHTVMEHMDVWKHRDLKSIHELCKDLIEKNILTPEEREAVPLAKLAKFANSPLAERMRSSVEVVREAPFVMGLPHSKALYGARDDDEQELVLVNGIIDCYFEEPDGIVIVDYKSDEATEKTKAEIAEKHRIQLQVYAQAIERGTGKRVKEAILYLFAIDQEVRVKLNPAGESIFEASQA
jgi:ATP-dependent helicase/nuclease subunit A